VMILGKESPRKETKSRTGPRFDKQTDAA